MERAPDGRETPPQDTPQQETPGKEAPGRERPAGLFVRRRPGEEFQEPKPVPRWIVLLGECALFGVPVLLAIVPFGARLPEFGLEPPLPAIIDLVAVLAVIFGSGAAMRAYVLGPSGAALRRFGSRARKWYAASRNRSVWTYLALLGLWILSFQLPRVSEVPAVVLAGTLLFCLATAFVIFTCGLMVAALRHAQDGDTELVEGVAAGKEGAPGEESTRGETEEEDERPH